MLQAIPRPAQKGQRQAPPGFRLAFARQRGCCSREALMDLDFAHLRRDLRALAASTRLDRSTFAARHEALGALLLGGTGT